MIASISLGVSRDFLLKRKNEAGGREESYVFKLAAGDLLVMKGGGVQKYYVHSVPKRMGVKEERINLTFRKVIKSNVKPKSSIKS